MVLDISPRLAGTVATAIGLLRKGYDHPDPQLRTQLAELEKMLRKEASRGQTRPPFDLDVFLSQADGMQPLLVTFKRAGQLLSYSTRSVRRLVHDGELTCIGTGPGARITVASIEAHVATLVAATAPSADDLSGATR